MIAFMSVQGQVILSHGDGGQTGGSLRGGPFCGEVLEGTFQGNGNFLYLDLGGD